MVCKKQEYDFIFKIWKLFRSGFEIHSERIPWSTFCLPLCIGSKCVADSNSIEMPKPLMIQTKSCSVLGCALKHLLIFTTNNWPSAGCWCSVYPARSQGFVWSWAYIRPVLYCCAGFGCLLPGMPVWFIGNFPVEHIALLPSSSSFGHGPFDGIALQQLFFKVVKICRKGTE